MPLSTWSVVASRSTALAILLLAGGASAAGAPSAGTLTTYRGPCDASAAVALDGRHFVAANDESDALGIYRQGQPERVGMLDLAAFLGTPRREESDIEGVAAIGSRIYWITSHSRNTRGEAQPSRHRVFATDVVAGAIPRAVPSGTPYRDLLEDLVRAPSLAAWNLAEASKRAAEATGGLNIEGLAATPEGRLLVGFRNPLREGRALVVPIDNPAEVVAGARARLGAPIELDLGGRGIRSLERVGSAYYVVAGPVGDSGAFGLYRWSGNANELPVPVALELGTLRPEALFAVPGTASIELLSDDGGILVDGRECKDLERSKQAFRALTVRP